MDQQLGSSHLIKRRRLEALRDVEELEDDARFRTLEKLPDELLLQILDHLVSANPSTSSATSVPTHSFYNLCMVNRRLNRITTPLLYEKFEREFSGAGLDISALALYMQTLRARPELRLCTKTLRRKLSPKYRFSSCYIQTDELMKGLADELELPDQDFVNRCGTQIEDYLLTLCAFLSPNLEHLETKSPEETWDPYIESMLLEHINRSALGRPVSKVHGFNRLRSLHVEGGGSFTIPNKHAFPLVLLPRLEHLILGDWGAVGNPGECDNMLDPNDSEVFGRPWKWPIRSSPISELSLRSPRTTAKLACQMILACKALRKFECTSTYKSQSPKNMGWYTHITSALNEHRHTLREINFREDFTGIRVGVQGRVSSLTHMSVLTHLRIPWSLLGVHGRGRLCNALPQSIEKLTIELATFGNEEPMSALTEFYEEMSTNFVALKHIHILWRTWESSPDIGSQMASIKRLLETSPVRFDVTFVRSDDYAPTQDTMRALEKFFSASVRYEIDHSSRTFRSQHHVKASTCVSDPQEFEELMKGYLR